jgi:hypothetical protein
MVYAWEGLTHLKAYGTYRYFRLDDIFVGTYPPACHPLPLILLPMVVARGCTSQANCSPASSPAAAACPCPCWGQRRHPPWRAHGGRAHLLGAMAGGAPGARARRCHGRPGARPTTVCMSPSALAASPLSSSTRESSAACGIDAWLRTMPSRSFQLCCATVSPRAVSIIFRGLGQTRRH